MAYKENNDNVKRKKEDAGTCKHHDLEEHDCVGVLGDVPFVVARVELVEACFANPIHCLSNTE